MSRGRCCLLMLAALLAACGRPHALSNDGSEEPSAPAPEVARNIILFIGDGMGPTTVTAARIFDGQSKGLSGEEHSLPFERFPNVALVKTYNTNQQVPDSAGTVTAILTGRKTRAGVINIGPDAKRRDCEAALANPLTTIVDLAKSKGKAVGFVTTTRITHATPAALYAKAPERDWEVDDYLPPVARDKGCRDIARQFVDFTTGGGIDVAMGGGRMYFYGSAAGGQRRAAGDDLVREWLDAAANRRFISTARELDSVRPGEQVLGLFARSHMTYIAERGERTTEPMLSQMTAAAIDQLADDPDGYFLLVEGGRIDHGHHIGKAGYAMLEAQEFFRAIELALEKADLAETLILVTADHSHVFTLGGYATRGNPILGLVVRNDTNGEPEPGPDLAADGEPYTTLAYANGPGGISELPRRAPETGIGARQQALVPMVHQRIDGTFENSETHGGEDVALYAIGNGSAAVRGVLEQNRIYDIMIRAYGWSAAR